jgi:hypothetical protein
MPVTATPIYPQTVKNWTVQIANADASNKKSLVAGGSNGSKVEMISVSSTDTSDRDINVYLNDGSTDHLLGTIKVPLSSGNTNAIVPVNFLSNTQNPCTPYDAMGNKYIYVMNGYTLKVAATTTVTSGKIIDFIAQGGDF